MSLDIWDKLWHTIVIWDEAYAEESARLDHEPEHEVRSNAHVADHPLNSYRFL